MTKTDEGYLIGKAIFTRTGIFKYQRADGTVYNELRTPEEVFNQDSIDSFKLKPITNDHPSIEVNADNIKDYQVGNIGEDLKRDGDNLVGSIIITDSKTIKDIKNGKRELSLGYKVALVKEDGQFQGENYQFKQTNIRGNHLAIVYQARAGHQARLNLDSQDAVCVNINNNKNNNMSEKDTKELQEKLDSLEANKKSLTDKIGELSIKVDSLEGERDALKSKLEEALKKDHSEEISQKVKARLDLEKTASKILKKDLSDISDKEIIVEVVNQEMPDLKLDGKSDEYLKACYDSCVSLASKKNLDKQKELFKGDSEKKDSKVELTQSEIINNRIKGIK